MSSGPLPSTAADSSAPEPATALPAEHFNAGVGILARGWRMSRPRGADDHGPRLYTALLGHSPALVKRCARARVSAELKCRSALSRRMGGRRDGPP